MFVNSHLHKDRPVSLFVFSLEKHLFRNSGCFHVLYFEELKSVAMCLDLCNNTKTCIKYTIRKSMPNSEVDNQVDVAASCLHNHWKDVKSP